MTLRTSATKSRKSTGPITESSIQQQCHSGQTSLVVYLLSTAAEKRLNPVMSRSGDAKLVPHLPQWSTQSNAVLRSNSPSNATCWRSVVAEISDRMTRCYICNSFCYYATLVYYVRRCSLLLQTEYHGLSVGLSQSWALQKWLTDWDAVWVENWVGPRKHVLGGVHTGTTWQIPLNHPGAVAMQPVVKLLWRLVYFYTSRGSTVNIRAWGKYKHTHHYGHPME